MKSRIQYCLYLLADVALLWSLTNPSFAGTLYDNLNLGNDLQLPPGVDVIGPRPDPGDRFFAQPFRTDDSGIVASACVLMQRLGSPAGPLHVDIWSDDGGSPAAQLGRLGSVDITTVPTDNTGTSILFDETLNLEPNSPYYLVVDNIDLNLQNRRDTFRLGMRTSEDGTNGASRTLVTAPNDADTWLALGDVLSGSNYLRMTVNAALSDLAHVADLNSDCILDISDIDLLTGEILAHSDNPDFDLSGDGTVNTVDLGMWLTHAATHNGFAEAYLSGDSNLDGSVEAMDLNNLALNWQQSANTWSGGDFNTDGLVSAVDLNTLALNWQRSVSMASSIAPVPEPSALVLAWSIAGLALFWLRSNRGR